MRLSSWELSVWKIWDQIEPIGDHRADMRVGQICNELRRCRGLRPLPRGNFLVQGTPPTIRKIKSKPKEGLAGDAAAALGLKFIPKKKSDGK